MVDIILDILEKDGADKKMLKNIKNKIKNKKMNFTILFMAQPEEGKDVGFDTAFWHFDCGCANCVHRLISYLEITKLDIINKIRSMTAIPKIKKEELKYIG